VCTGSSLELGAQNTILDWTENKERAANVQRKTLKDPQNLEELLLNNTLRLRMSSCLEAQNIKKRGVSQDICTVL